MSLLTRAGWETSLTSPDHLRRVRRAMLPSQRHARPARPDQAPKSDPVVSAGASHDFAANEANRLVVEQRPRIGITRPSTTVRSNEHAPDAADMPGSARTDAVDVPLLYTAEQAALLLQVRPSWLRRKAAARAVPCRFVGKHLRFSRADIEAIAEGNTP